MLKRKPLAIVEDNRWYLELGKFGNEARSRVCFALATFTQDHYVWIWCSTVRIGVPEYGLAARGIRAKQDLGG
jgi:hypothetical protein